MVPGLNLSLIKRNELVHEEVEHRRPLRTCRNHAWMRAWGCLQKVRGAEGCFR